MLDLGTVYLAPEGSTRTGGQGDQAHQEDDGYYYG